MNDIAVEQQETLRQTFKAHPLVLARTRTRIPEQPGTDECVASLPMRNGRGASVSARQLRKMAAACVAAAEAMEADAQDGES